MGLFNRDDLCAVCNKKTNVLTRAKLKDGFLCDVCKTWCSEFVKVSEMSSADAREHIQKTLKDESIYSSLGQSTSVEKYFVSYPNERIWACMIEDGVTPYLFSYDDIINYELIVDGVSLTSGGLGSAAVGGFLFGGVGAVVGGTVGKKQSDVVNKIAIRVSTKDRFIPHVEICLLNFQQSKNSLVYKTCMDNARKILSLLDKITYREPTKETSSNTNSIADELLKFKQLLDMGAITESEFETKKRDLLGK